MTGGLAKIHRDVAKFRGFEETLFAEGRAKLLDKAKHFIHVTICAVISTESDGLSSLLELLEPLGASP